MDDTPKPEQPEKGLNQIDLNQLQSFSFGTQWTQDKSSGRGGDAGGRDGRRDERPRREGPAGDGKRDRRGFKRPVGAPGSERPEGARPEGGRPRSPGGERGPGGERVPGGGRREGGPRGPRPEGDRRFGGPPRGEPVDRGPYLSPHFNVTFYPDDTGFAALSKAMRSSCRTYELFEIAKVIVGKNDRFLAVVQRKSSGGPKTEGDANKPRGFYLSVPDGVPFESESAAVEHVMKVHLGQFFETEEVEVEPPTGNFQVINRCPVTGELLGPPNYHLYNQLLQQHHAAHIKLPLEVYRNRIETVRDTEVVAQWLEKMKKATRYTWKGLPSRQPRPSKAAAAAAAAAAAEGEKISVAPSDSPEMAEVNVDTGGNDGIAAPGADSDATTMVAPDNSADSSDEISDAAAGADEARASNGEGVTDPITEPAPEASPEPTPVIFFTSLEEAKEHLLQNARNRVVRSLDTLRFPGRLLEKLPDGEIRRAIEGQLERQRRFPLDTANALRGRLRREGFTIFKKGSKGISYVCAVKRKFRVPGQQFADSIDALIRFIEGSPMVKQSELARKFLGLVPPEIPVASPEAAAEVAAAAVPESVVPEPPAIDAAVATPEAAPAEAAANTEVEAPSAEAAAPEDVAPDTASASNVETTPVALELSTEDRARLTKLQYDLRWLVSEGYVTEFIDGRLFAAPAIVEARKKQIEDGEDDTENFPEAAAEESKETAVEVTSGTSADASVVEQVETAQPSALDEPAEPTEQTTAAELAEVEEVAPQAMESDQAKPVETATVAEPMAEPASESAIESQEDEESSPKTDEGPKN